MGARKDRNIWASIDLWMDLCERGICADLVGDGLEERRDREGRVAKSDEEEEDRLAHSFCSTLLSGKMRQVVH